MIVTALLLALAQTTPAPATAAPTIAVPASRLNLDTPVEAIVADAKGKAVLDADLPTLAVHPMYDTFKGMSLRQLQSYAPDRLTDATMTKVAGDLAKVN